MAKKVFCGGLPYAWDDQDLTSALSQFGPVVDAKVIMDRDTGQSRGFGFVTFENEEDATTAVNVGSITGDGRTVHINMANDQGRGKNHGKGRK